ncbi:MAG: MFS transporter [Actinomycetes bacterium]
MHQIFKPLQEPTFRRLWILSLVSSLGDQIFPICATVVVLHSGSGAMAISFIMSIRVIAFLLFAPIGGVWADRLPRVKVMISSSFFRSALCVGVYFSSAHVNLQFLGLLVFLMGVAEAFSGPASGAVIPSLVKDSDLQSANALRAMSGRVSSIAGPGIAAALIALVGSRQGFLLTALGFLISGLGLLRVPDAESLNHPGPEIEGFIEQAKAGYYYIRNCQWLFVTMIALALQTSILFGAEMVLLPVITARQFESTSVYPMAIASLSIGSMLSAFFASKIESHKKGLISFLSWTVLVILPLALIFPISKIFVICCYFVGGVATQPMGVFYGTALQRQVPTELRARVMSLDAMITGSLIPGGMMLAGPASEYFGEKNYLAGTALTFLIISVIVLRIPSVKSFGEVVT